jgi:hypothetical protein
MHLPPLVQYQSEDDYYQHFCREYCNTGIKTFDRIVVDFYPRQFSHAFRESANRKEEDKSIFSTWRAQRIDWIKWALLNPNAELYQGWDNAKKMSNPRRRVCIVVNNYVVVIQIKGDKKAFFITAFQANSRTLGMIRSNPIWT